MKKLFLFSLLVAATSLRAQTTGFFPDQLDRYKLKNGLEVIFADYGNLPVTTMRFFVNTGRKNETPGQQHLSDLTASALLLGNSKYTRSQTDDKIYALGGSLSAESNDNFTTISAQFLNKHLADGMELVAACMLNPSFPKKEIDELVGMEIAYNKPSKMDISELSGMYSDYFVYSTSNPLGRHFYEAQLKKITPDSIRAYYQFNFTPKNTKLVITGKPDKAEVKKLLEQYFGSWTAAYGEVNGVSFDAPSIKTKEYAFVNKTGVTQAALNWAKRGPAAGSKDIPAFQLANTIFSDQLFQEIRQKRGYTYGIQSIYSDQTGNGLYHIRTQVRNDVVYDAMIAFDEALANFEKNGITDAELKKAKTILRMRYLGSEDPGALANAINPWVYKDYAKRKTYLDEIDKLDVATVNKVVKKYFTSDSYKCVIAGDDAVIGTQISKISGVQKLDLKVIEKDN